MIVIRDDQFAILETCARKEFLLAAVCDWFAIYKQAYGRFAVTPFDEAWDLADHVVDELEDVAWNPEVDLTYAVVHEVLLGNEKGATTACIDRALNLFCDAMPSDEAAYSLLTIELKQCQRGDTGAGF